MSTLPIGDGVIRTLLDPSSGSDKVVSYSLAIAAMGGMSFLLHQYMVKNPKLPLPTSVTKMGANFIPPAAIIGVAAGGRAALKWHDNKPPSSHTPKPSEKIVSSDKNEVVEEKKEAKNSSLWSGVLSWIGKNKPDEDAPVEKQVEALEVVLVNLKAFLKPEGSSSIRASYVESHIEQLEQTITSLQKEKDEVSSENK